MELLLLRTKPLTQHLIAETFELIFATYYKVLEHFMKNQHERHVRDGDDEDSDGNEKQDTRMEKWT